MKNKAKRVARDVWGYRQGDGVVENMVRNCDNLKVCNGDCCKNPRRSGWEPAKGKTRQEYEL